MNLFRRLVLFVSALAVVALALAAAGTTVARAEVPYVTQIVRELASGENGRVWSDPDRGDAFNWETKEVWADKLHWLVNPENDDRLNVEVFVLQVDYDKAMKAADTRGGYDFIDTVERQLRKQPGLQDANIVLAVTSGDSFNTGAEQDDESIVEGVKFYPSEEVDTLPPTFADDLDEMTVYVDQQPETINDPEALVGMWVDGLIELAEYYHEGAEPQDDPTDEATASASPTASPSPTASADTRTPAEVRGHPMTVGWAWVIGIVCAIIIAIPVTLAVLHGNRR